MNGCSEDFCGHDHCLRKLPNLLFQNNMSGYVYWKGDILTTCHFFWSDSVYKSYFVGMYYLKSYIMFVIMMWVGCQWILITTVATIYLFLNTWLIMALKIAIDAGMPIKASRPIHTDIWKS